MGPRGRRLPDWQLDPVQQQLTQAVLKQASKMLDELLTRHGVDTEAVVADSKQARGK